MNPPPPLPPLTNPPQTHIDVISPPPSPDAPQREPEPTSLSIFDTQPDQKHITQDTDAGTKTTTPRLSKRKPFFLVGLVKKLKMKLTRQGRGTLPDRNPQPNQLLPSGSAPEPAININKLTEQQKIAHIQANWKLTNIKRHKIKQELREY